MRGAVSIALLLATAGPVAAGDRKVIYLVNHGWHVGIAVSRADVSATVWPESADVPRRHIEVGWGDGGYYPAADPGVGAALTAALSSESSVLHVAGFDPPVAEFFAGAPVVAIALSPQGFDALSRFVHEHYARDGAGRPVVVAPGRYGDARFYRAMGRYRLFENSNTWAAKALRAAGCPIDASAVTAGSVTRQVKELPQAGCR